MDNPYEAAWAYLQGCIETLVPLVPDLPSTKVQERLQYALTVGYSLAHSIIAEPDNGVASPEKSPEENDAEYQRWLKQPAVNASGGVYFPHDLQHSGEGTFTAPGATEEEIEALMKQRYPDGEREE